MEQGQSQERVSCGRIRQRRVQSANLIGPPGDARAHGPALTRIAEFFNPDLSTGAVDEPRAFKRAHFRAERLAPLAPRARTAMERRRQENPWRGDVVFALCARRQFCDEHGRCIPRVEGMRTS